MIARQNFLTRLLDSQTLERIVVAARIARRAARARADRGATILQDDVAPGVARGTRRLSRAAAVSAALAALSAENYDQRVSGAAYLTMATPALNLQAAQLRIASYAQDDGELAQDETHETFSACNGLRARRRREHRSRLRASARAVAAARACRAARIAASCSINLYGGNDGLNCVVPHGDDRYYQLRPTLAIDRNDVLAIDARRRLESRACARSRRIYDKGMVAIVQGVGYPNPDHSHFRSTEIWQTAAPDRYEHTGWLGRYFDEAGLPQRESLQRRRGLASSARSARLRTAPTFRRSPASAHTLVADRNAAVAQRVLARGARPQPAVRLALSGHVMEIEDHAQRGSEELPQLDRRL